MNPAELRQAWEHALTFEQFLTQSREEHRALWEGIHRHMKAPDWAVEAVGSTPVRLLVITEDWCMDGSSTAPALLRLAEAAPAVQVRFLLRDENPAIMDRYLTNGARSIPVVIVLDEEFRELGFWGPRPRELQAWVMQHKATMPKEERLREQRRWYARDRGETTLREVLAIALRTSSPS